MRMDDAEYNESFSSGFKRRKLKEQEEIVKIKDEIVECLEKDAVY